MCQHPAVQAVLLMSQLEEAAETMDMMGSFALHQLNELDRLYAEVVASEFVPQFFVGFYNPLYGLQG
jgi:hypothetical protein